MIYSVYNALGESYYLRAVFDTMEEAKNFINRRSKCEICERQTKIEVSRLTTVYYEILQKN